MLVHSATDLASFVKDQRKLKKLSQADIARDISLRQDTVSKFELKPDNVRLDTLFRILSSLDLEVHITGKGISASDDKNGWTEKW